MVFVDEFRAFQNDMQTILCSYFDQKIAEASARPVIAEMLSQIRDLTLRGGKRLRPALMLGSYLCFRSDDVDRVKIAAAACELMQSSLLIHDDIMDHSTIRRGGPTLHLAYEQTAAHLSPDNSEAMAILAGDTAGYLGLELLEHSGLPASAVGRVVSLYARVMVDETYGQALDVYPRDISSLSEADVLDIYRYKTARYTTEFPLMAGALLAGQDDRASSTLGQIGIDLGIAFQIQDDILGAFGDPAVIGKSTLSDLAEGKKTLLAVKAFEAASPEQRGILDELFGQGALTDAQGEQVRQIMRETGALDYAQNAASVHFGRGRGAIEESSYLPPGRQWLLQLVTLIEHRNV